MKKQKTSAKNDSRGGKSPTAAQMKKYEASAADKLADKKGGAREGSAADRKQDLAGARKMFGITAVAAKPLEMAKPRTMATGKKAKPLASPGKGAY